MSPLPAANKIIFFLHKKERDKGLRNVNISLYQFDLKINAVRVNRRRELSHADS